MKNKSFEILAIILLINLLLLLIAFVPAHKIQLQDDYYLKLLSYESISDFKFMNQNETADSLISIYTTSKKNRLNRKSLSGIEPKSKNDFLYNLQTNNEFALDNFFKSLQNEINNKVVRIVHYGDSQLEGDRISCYLRSLFQKKFGGTGIGFVPFEDIADNVNFFRISSPNWHRYTVFHNRYANGNYGLSGNVYKFSKYAVKKNNTDTTINKEDSILTKVETPIIYKNATVSINLNNYIAFQKLSLMYGRSSSECMMNIYNIKTNEKIVSENLAISPSFNLQTLNIPSSVKSFRLEFSGDVSPDFYGILIDGNKGIQVDNYAIRGHSGDGLLLINPEYLALQLKELNVKLVVFQYGNNVVPYTKSVAACEQMGQMYYSIFSRFKKAAKDISVIVVGAGDMAYMNEGKYVSYPYIAKIKDAQKKAALDAGCAFWDLYNVMGGNNSVLSWTKNGLATFDGHFSSKGQKVIGNELFKALMIEYNQFLFRQRKKENI
ncbi:MAG TPA: hypothetical protein PKZ21_04270 [Bacteroidales bacterium]|nr:hypothetical protein [Bacteroidales bacterium]